jgi:hypothetical protein
MPHYDAAETIEEIRALNVFQEAGTKYNECHFTPDSAVSADAKAICSTIMIAADIIRRSIVAAHDSLKSAAKSPNY